MRNKAIGMQKTILLFFFTFCYTAVGFAQSTPQTQSDLEKQRVSIQKEIEEVKSQLKNTHNNKKQTLGQLALLQKRLQLREQAISNINQQLNLIQANMNTSWREIIKLREELVILRKQYAESVIYAYENRTNYDYLNFLFASGNFNDAVKRVEYLKSYRTYREQRAENIQKTQILLQNKIDGLKSKRVEKDAALIQQNKERQILETEKNEKDQVVEQLQGQEKELKKEMNAKRRQDQKLSNAIATAIRRAREDAIRDAKKSAAKDAVTKVGNTPPVKNDESKNAITSNNPGATPSKLKAADPIIFKTTSDILLTDNFEKNKGRMPWPIASGTISMKFGLHEYIKGVKHNNIGITIESLPGSSVNAVFDGIVEAVFFVGDVTVVMIRHGKYFTTYSNLSSASVSKGQMVKTGQLLGRLSDPGQLEFLISDENAAAFDPELWLRK